MTIRSMDPQIDHEAAMVRQHEIAKVLAQVDASKRRLGSMLRRQALTPDDMQLAKRMNSSSNPLLAKLWAEFIALPLADQEDALAELRFKGMHWQSLMQANPFAVTDAWRKVANETT